ATKTGGRADKAPEPPVKGGRPSQQAPAGGRIMHAAPTPQFVQPSTNPANVGKSFQVYGTSQQAFTSSACVAVCRGGINLMVGKFPESGEISIFDTVPTNPDHPHRYNGTPCTPPSGLSPNPWCFSFTFADVDEGTDIGLDVTVSLTNG